MLYKDMTNWQNQVFKKYKDLTARKTSRNLMFYNSGRLVATFNLNKNEGVIL